MTRAHARTIGLALAVAAILCLVPAGPARAANRNFTLYGEAATGWGATNTTIASPGPTLLVAPGDNVTLTLNATDGLNHNWFVDYNNDSNDGGSEPGSPNFRDEQIQWNFTADQAGTFTYRCKFHPADMKGLIVISNGTSPPGTPSGTNVGLIVGLVLVVVVIIAVLFYLATRKRKGESPPRPS